MSCRCTCRRSGRQSERLNCGSCKCAGRDDIGSHELAVLSTSQLVVWLVLVFSTDRRAATGEDAGAGGAAGGDVPLARGASNTAPGIRSSRSSSSGV